MAFTSKIDSAKRLEKVKAITKKWDRDRVAITGQRLSVKLMDLRNALESVCLMYNFNSRVPHTRMNIL